VGDKLQLIPPRVCTAVNLYDELHAVENGERVATWRVTARGKSR